VQALSYRRSDEEVVRDLVDVLTTIVEPDGWIVNGGDAANCQVLDTRLIIKGSPVTHAAIVDLLALLRHREAGRIRLKGSWDARPSGAATP
jgi:hypothetical protein